MYINVAYLENMLESYLTPVDCADNTVPLKILCCGFYRVTDMDSVIETNRPGGRKDYQLLYFHAGKGHFSFTESSEIRTASPAGESRPVHSEKEDLSASKTGCPSLVNAGQFVLFRPGDRQVYEYYPPDHTEVYWIHFTGYDVEKILERFGFSKEELRGQSSLADICHPVYWGGVSLEYQNLFRKMIKELQLCRKNYEEIIAFQFQELLALAGRNRHNPHVTSTPIEQVINDSLVYFDENYAKPIKVDEYAASVYVSPCWFIRSFRNYIGMTPLQYIINVRMANARELLLNPAFSVADVSRAVGYEDPLYFSRFFKKNIGLSPREYKKTLRRK